MASKNINIPLLLTINLVFFGFTMAQDPVPQAPTCPLSSTLVESCVSRIVDALGSSFILKARLCCFSLKVGLDDSVVSACLCDAVKVKVAELEDPFFVPNDVFRGVRDACFITSPPGFRCD
ncbi:hypothetical protein Bca4012_022596 [Brassica carinata]